MLWNELNAVDPEAASKISVNNPRRVIRALEVIHATGKKFFKPRNSKDTTL